MRMLPIFFLSALLLAVLAGAVYFWYIMDAAFRDGPEIPTEVIVHPGMGLNELATNLEKLGLLENASYFMWRYRIASRLGLAGAYQAGRYRLPPGLRPSELIDDLTNPDASMRVYTRFTVPPGSTSSRIARILQDAGISSANYVRQAILELSGNYPIMQTSWGLQGYLFPDTYKMELFSGNGEPDMKENAELAVKLMADRFFQALSEIEPRWTKLTKLQLHEKVILASVIEREYRITEEAPKIAAVFNNRMNREMLLQSCATVAYIIEETNPGMPYKANYFRFNRRIFEQHLEIESPFNTYIHSGLPPAPIAVSGHTALEAAFRPAHIDALYFVVQDPAKGTHVFTENYSDHLNARDVYLKQYVVKK